MRCGRCDGEIYEGAEYYQINGECVCRECLEEFAGHWFAPFRLIAGGGAMKGRGESFWREVRRAYENGEGSYQTLADRFGVSRGAMASHGRIEGWNRKKNRRVRICRR